MYADVFICGTIGADAKVSMIIKDEDAKVIAEHSHITQRFGYSEKIPLNDILSSLRFDNNGIVSVFFSIDSEPEKFTTSFLLGKIKFK